MTVGSAAATDSVDDADGLNQVKYVLLWSNCNKVRRDGWVQVLEARRAQHTIFKMDGIQPDSFVKLLG